MLKRFADIFLFSSFYISVCAVLMAWQTIYLMDLYYQFNYLSFVFFSTVASYNFHWLLTPADAMPSRRLGNTDKVKRMHLILTVTGILGAGILF
ncbi:MAG TPA: hypothetical protein VM012_03075, partial [Flavitalea sp.]|nr:hypothetical protein [Flavitalea sp.]